MNLRLYLAGLLLAIAPLSLHSQSQVDKLPKPTDYVSDLANVIDSSSKERIDELCSQLDHQAHAQVAVVTIDSLNGEPIEQFATELEDKWKVGPKSTDRGLIMIFAIKDHKRRIEVGYGLEGILNDAKVGDIGRSMVPQLQQSQYGPAIVGGLQQIADVISKDSGVTLTPPAADQSNPYQQDQPAYQNQPRHRGSNIGGIIRLIILAVIVISIFSGRGRGGGGWLWFLLGNMLGGGGGGGRGRDDGWGGGGGGGGGGGFGGFGGGSSGGGGASGDW